MLKYIYRSLFTVLIVASFAISPAKPSDAIVKMIQEMKLDKNQISSMIDQLVAGGQISKADAKLAKEKLKTLSEKDLKTLKGKAVQKIKKDGIPNGVK